MIHRSTDFRGCIAEALEPRTLFAVPAGFAETLVATGLGAATRMAVAPDGRVFVNEKSGAVRIIQNGSLLAQPLVRVTVDSSGERGLGGIVLDPNFASNGHIYLYHTVSSPTTHNRISRYTVSGSGVVTGSQQVILDLPTISATIHNGGAMRFGSDGKLYVSVGDASNSPNSQDLSTPFGKILRINPDGSAAAGNPFIGTANADERIWALGVRNPWGMDIQPGTGTIVAGDVGPGALPRDPSVWEEVNRIERGKNYGWPIVRGGNASGGASLPAGYQDPVFTYQHGANESNGCAVTGIAFYNPPAGPGRFPASYVGDVFYADFCGGYIRVLNNGGGSMSEFATGLRYPVDLVTAPDGSLYYLSYGQDEAGTGGGRVYRITHTGSVGPSIAEEPQSRIATIGESVTFTVVVNGSGLAYQWQRNGQDIPGATGPTYTLPSVSSGDSGAVFRVRVSNPQGTATSANATLTVTSEQRPTAIIANPANGALYTAGDTITFNGSGSDPEDGTLPASALKWRVLFHHDTHSHPFVDEFTGSGGTFTIPTIGETADDVWYRIYLTATDSDGLSTTVTRDVNPRRSRITLTSNLPAAELTLDGQPLEGPVTVTGVAGMQRTIGAPARQEVGGVTYEFVEWSDRGAINHGITTRATDTVYTATYRPATSTGGGGVGGGSTAPLADLVGDLSKAIASAALGTYGKITLTIRNQGTVPSAGRGVVQLFLSQDGVLDAGDRFIGQATKGLRMKVGRGKLMKIKVAYPPSLPAGSYTLIAHVDTYDAVAELDKANNIAAGPFGGVTLAAGVLATR